MKKSLLFTSLALISILLCAFSVAPAPGSEKVPSMAVRITSDFSSDGSGKLSMEMELSQEFMTLLKSFGGSDADITCDTFFESAYDEWEMTETNRDGALVCTAGKTFEDLDEYESLVLGDLSDGSFTRLEIEDGHFYYDLMPAMMGSSVFGEMEQESGFEVEVLWILKMPGEVVDSNADEKAGQTLTWNILEMNAASHIRAECKVGGGGLFGLDPTLTVMAMIGLMCCCCLVILIAGGAVFFFLRRKKTAATVV